jgi:hypothetical protein
VKYTDMKGTSHLGQRQLYLRRCFAQKCAEAEGKCFGIWEPTWIGWSVQVSSLRQLHLRSFLGVYQGAEKKGLRGN